MIFTARSHCLTWLGPAAVLALSPAGCSIALQTSAQQCVEDADCTARGGDFAGTVCIDEVCQEPPDTSWACVGDVKPPPAGQPYTISIRLNDLLATKLVTDASVKLCKKLDLPCDVPVETLAPDAKGIVSADIETGFRGYFAVDALGYVPTLYFIDTSAGAGPFDVSLFTPQASDALNKGVTSDIDPEAGFVNIAMYDCMDRRAAGVHFDIAPAAGTTPFYALASAASGTATETDATGNGGFINVPPGIVTLTATLASTGELLSTETTLIRKATLSYQTIRPAQAQ